MAVRYDIFNPASQAKLTQQGWEFERSAIVDGIVSTGPAAIVEAVNQAGLSIGQAHPEIRTAKLEDILPSNIAPGVVTLRLTYREHYTTKLIEVGTTLQNETTNKDKDGNLIAVTYNGTITAAMPNGNNSQNASVSFPRPHTTFSITRQEEGSPGDKSRQYVGKVNDAGWLIDPTSGERNWMITGIVGRSRDGGNTYEVVYTGEYKGPPPGKTDGGWDQTAIYIDPTTGRLPADVQDDDDQAVKRFQIADTADFNELQLDQ